MTTEGTRIIFPGSDEWKEVGFVAKEKPELGALLAQQRLEGSKLFEQSQIDGLPVRHTVYAIKDSGAEDQ